MNPKLVEWTGAILGLLGSLLLALKLDVSGWGFIAFLVSNLFWLAYGFKNRAWGLVTMQLGYSVTSLMGIYNWFIKPAMGIFSGL
ncbi:hypothetical protein KTD31_03420 [Burkholderia multivorans]|jgi:hypothetical protein|uniref:hypothetical protein n=1 Tax=Burkholderia multivorans TaxID=87883 RepID=UPI001C2235B0|nr:hypothetical protein [Burkholderia multivorans]MBU9200403.1 hypothetical protein [Burkholderia multivorans]MDN8078472.1 hypothetical protein [Burkholderia multivorans]